MPTYVGAPTFLAIANRPIEHGGRAIARTQQERKQETRRRLLQAAASLFAQGGVDGASVDAIADAAERTSGSVYAHFGGKQGILLALAEGFQDDLAAVIQAEFAAREDLAGRLLGLWQNVAHHPDDDGAQWFLLEVELWLRAVRDPEVGGPLGDRYRQVHALMQDEFTAWLDEFDLRPVVAVERLAQAVMAALMGLAMQRAVVPEAVDDDLAVQTLLSLFGAGNATT